MYKQPTRSLPSYICTYHYVSHIEIFLRNTFKKKNVKNKVGFDVQIYYQGCRVPKHFAHFEITKSH